MKIRENVKIAELTTMRLGGAARYVVEIEALDDVVAAYDFAREKGLPTFVLGGGANTLGRDEGFDGVILLNRLKGMELKEISSSGVNEGATRELRATDAEQVLLLSAMGGEIWDDVVAVACERGYTGIEALSAIPGTAGAAPVQNIGAYGQEVSQTLESVEAYDTRERKFVTLRNRDLGFGYRKSALNTGAEKGRYFIVKVLLKLQHGEMQGELYGSLQAYLDEHQIRDRSPLTIRRAVIAVRDSKLPRPEVLPSAGSFFKNIYVDKAEAERLENLGVPVRVLHENADTQTQGLSEESAYGKVNTGWLIEDCGLKGQLLHGIRVNPEAALVLINESATCYDDLAKARAEIQAAVKEKFGVEITQEPEEIGD